MTTWLTVKEVQKILKLSKNQVYAIVNNSDFPKIRFGRSIRIPEDRLEEWLENNLYKEYII